MAVKTYLVAAGQDGNFGALVDGTDQTAASRTDGWTSAKISSALSAEYASGTKQLSGSFSSQSTTPKPASFLTGSTANAFKIPAALTGVFAATAWTFTFALRATNASSQAGRMRLRVFKATNALGTTGVVELTSATQVGTTSGTFSTSADVTSVVTWSPGTTITLNNEFLFFVLAWEITTAGGANAADVVIRTGQAAGGSRLVTPSATLNTPITMAATITLTPAMAKRQFLSKLMAMSATLTPAVSKKFARTFGLSSTLSAALGKVFTLYTPIQGSWKLDENPAIHGTTIVDSSGKGNNGILTTNEGSTNKSVSGKVGTAITFDGVDDSLITNVNVFKGIGAGDFTIAAWIRDTDPFNLSSIVAKDDSTSHTMFLTIDSDISGNASPGKIIAFISANQYTTYWALTTDGTPITPYDWHRVVWRRMVGVITLWVDGVSVPFTPTSVGGGTPDLTIQEGTANFTIGGRPEYTSVTDFFSGDLDQVDVYSRALTDAEIAAEVAKNTAIQLDGTVILSPTIGRKGSLVRTMAISSTLTPVMGTFKKYFRAQAATATFAPTMAKRLAALRLQVVSTPISPSLTARMAAARLLAAPVTISASMNRLVKGSRRLDATATVIPNMSLGNSKNQFLNRPIFLTANIGRSMTMRLAASVNFIMGSQRKTSKDMPVTSTLTPTIGKLSRFSRRFDSVASLQVDLDVASGKKINLSSAISFSVRMAAGRVNRIVLSVSSNFTALMGFVRYFARKTVNTLFSASAPDAQLLAAQDPNAQADLDGVSDEETAVLLSASYENAELVSASEETPGLRSVS